MARAVPGDVADLVATRLADLGAVAFHLALGSRPREPSRRDHIVGRLLAAPALEMDAGVDREARGAEQEGLEISGLFDSAVSAKLIRQLLRIKRPAFRVGREAAGLADRRDVLRFLGDADLQMMPGDALVVGQRGKRIFRPVAGVLEVDEVDCGPGAVERGGPVIAVRRAVLDLGRDAPDLERDGVRAVIADALMPDAAAEARLARVVLDAAGVAA